MVLGSATPAVDSAVAGSGRLPASGAARSAEWRTAGRGGRRPAGGAGGRQPRPAVAAPVRRAGGPRYDGRRAGDPGPQSAGTASVVLCRDCGHVQACPDCERPLVYHQAGITLRCHHCGRATPLATRCPNCGSPRIRYLGGGTERVEREVRAAFPDLRVGRLDRDIVERRGAADRVVDAFSAARSTCSSARAWSPRASTSRMSPWSGWCRRTWRSTFPTNARPSGRTSSSRRPWAAPDAVSPGRAILQTYQPDHPAIQAVATGDAARFYAAELACASGSARRRSVAS